MMSSSLVSRVGICCLCRGGSGGESYRESGRLCLRRLEPHVHYGWPVSFAVPYGIRSVSSAETDGIPTVHITGIIYTVFCPCVPENLINI
jgi:hypothetical protein